MRAQLSKFSVVPAVIVWMGCGASPPTSQAGGGGAADGEWGVVAPSGGADSGGGSSSGGGPGAPGTSSGSGGGAAPSSGSSGGGGGSPSGSGSDGGSGGSTGGGNADAGIDARAAIGGDSGRSDAGNADSARGDSGGPAPVATGPFTPPADACAARAGYRDLFLDLLGKADADVDAKLEAGFQSLFHGTADETVYHEVGTDQAYILDVNDNDVRSEGISYGMMIAVQLGKQDEFNRIWNWAKQHMFITSGAQAGYFSWQLSPSGQILGATSAPDGEEYIATALVFASHRWGDGTGTFAYSTQASALLDALANKGDFSQSNKMVTFGVGTTFTDASYFLPAFYQVWACFDTKNQAFWKSTLSTARTFFQKTTDPTTGLAPGLSNFDGSGRSDFNSDAWRVVGNIMMDSNLYAADPWQTTFAAKYAAFFKSAWAKAPYGDEFMLNGTATRTNAERSIGLLAQNALAAFGVPAADGTPLVQSLWDTPPPTGQFRYFDGMLYMLASLHVGGRFHLW